MDSIASTLLLCSWSRSLGPEQTAQLISAPVSVALEETVGTPFYNNRSGMGEQKEWATSQVKQAILCPREFTGCSGSKEDAIQWFLCRLPAHSTEPPWFGPACLDIFFYTHSSPHSWYNNLNFFSGNNHLARIKPGYHWGVTRHSWILTLVEMCLLNGVSWNDSWRIQ